MENQKILLITGTSRGIGQHLLEELRKDPSYIVYGSVHMIKAMTPVFLDQKSGKIINMSSLGGLLSLPYQS